METKIIASFVLGVFVASMYFQPLLTDQSKKTSELQKLYDTKVVEVSVDDQMIIHLSDQLSSASATIKVLEDTHPKIKYIKQTEYVNNPLPKQQEIPQNNNNQTWNCSPDYAGGQNCYSSNGSYKHCSSNYAGGVNCY